MISKKHLIIAVAAGAAVLAVIFFFAFSGGKKAQTPENKPTQQTRQDTTLPRQAPQPPYGATIADAVNLNTQTYNMGLYKVDMQDFETATLTNKFDFIAQAITPVKGPYEDDDEIPELPPYIKLANIVIPSKKLDLVIIHSIFSGGNGSWCNNGFCIYDVYIKHNGKYEGYKHMMVKPPTYLAVEDKSISLIVCDTRQGYRQWRLNDGALDKPLPMDAPGYFVPVGAFKNDKLEACP